MQGGLPVAYAPLVLVAMNAVYSLGAYPFGKLADRMSAQSTARAVERPLQAASAPALPRSSGASDGLPIPQFLKRAT